MNSNEKMQWRKVCWVLRYHTPNKYRFTEKYVHHLIFPFFLFRSEKELLGGHLSTFDQGKLVTPGVMDIINENQQKFEPYAAMCWQGIYKSQLRICWQPRSSRPNWNWWNRWANIKWKYRANWTEFPSSWVKLALGDFIPKIATDDEIAANIRSLNKKQCMVFDVLQQWARN